MASAEERGVKEPSVPQTVENVGSTARDGCAIERNYLAHIRLGLLLSLLSSSLLLNTRLSGRGEHHSHEFALSQLPLASLFFVSSLSAIAAGWWAYDSALRDHIRRKAFVGKAFMGFQFHEVVIGVIALFVSGTCIYLLILGN